MIYLRIRGRSPGAGKTLVAHARRSIPWASPSQSLNASFTEVIGQPFSCEPRPPEEFYQNLLAAGAEPAYMKCVYDCYSNFTTGTSQKSDEVFDNFPAITGRK